MNMNKFHEIKLILLILHLIFTTFPVMRLHYNSYASHPNILFIFSSHVTTSKHLPAQQKKNRNSHFIVLQISKRWLCVN